MQTDGLVNLIVEFSPAPHLLRREPAAHALALQVVVKALGKGLVVVGVADKQE